jgi:hypothetical protein
MKSGRRSCGSSTSDALGIGAQLNGRSTINSLEEVVSESVGEEIHELHDVLSDNDEDPSQIAARRLDWEAFLKGLTAREKAVIEFILAGRKMSEVAVQFRVSLSTIQTCRNRLADRILDYMGHDILKDIRRSPSWRNNLNAARERLACKNHRRHL